MSAAWVEVCAALGVTGRSESAAAVAVTLTSDVRCGSKAKPVWNWESSVAPVRHKLPSVLVCSHDLKAANCSTTVPRAGGRGGVDLLYPPGRTDGRRAVVYCAAVHVWLAVQPTSAGRRRLLVIGAAPDDSDYE